LQYGDLYGVAWYGGANTCGVLYRLSKRGAFTVLHSFGGSDGSYPYGSVVMDEAGNVYGTTNGGGGSGGGAVWKWSKRGGETILHDFAGPPSDGRGPLGGVALDSEGNIYGSTSEGGANWAGTVYELTAKGTFTLLHSFDLTGYFPVGEVLRTTDGTLFGTTLVGGTGNCDSFNYEGCGTVWSYVP